MILSARMWHAVIRRLVSVALLSVLSSAAFGDVPNFHGTVTRVVNGDVVMVRLASGSIRVRLQGVDAPEPTQAGSAEAMEALSRLVLNRKIEIETVRQDRPDRLVGRVLLDGRDIGSMLVSEGHAWAYSRYMKPEDAQYCTLEESARQARRGLWSTPALEWIPPWTWRKTRRRTGAAPAVPGTVRTEAECRREIGLALS